MLTSHRTIFYSLQIDFAVFSLTYLANLLLANYDWEADSYITGGKIQNLSINFDKNLVMPLGFFFIADWIAIFVYNL